MVKRTKQRLQVRRKAKVSLDSSRGMACLCTLIGDHLMMMNSVETARDSYWQALSIDADYLPPLHKLALLYQVQGKTSDALSLYSEYLSRVPDDGEAHHNLALLYQKQGREAEAAAEFEIAAQLIAPDTPEAATNLGVGYFHRGELELALILYEHALELDPQFMPARYHAGIACLYLGQLENAVTALEAVVQAEPDYIDAAINLGVAYNTAGRSAEAIALFEALLQHDPPNPSAVLNLGFALLESGNRIRAEACFSWCVDSCPPDSVYAQKAAQMLENQAITISD